MYDIAPEVVSIADACLGGLRGRSALLIGSAEQRSLYLPLLQRFKMKYVYEEETAERVSSIIPSVQLLISLPTAAPIRRLPLLQAATIAKGCEGRHTPLLIFDLGPTTSVDELAGLLPAVCLYTPQDLHGIIAQTEAKAS